jgi:cytochrome c553
MNGNSASGIESIGGDSAAELVSEMLEMKYSTNANDIMHRQAMGYSEDQIRSLAAYIATLPKGSNGGND